eukprot:423460-Amorphochlora_amoeboformis.AAC.1
MVTLLPSAYIIIVAPSLLLTLTLTPIQVSSSVQGRFFVSFCDLGVKVRNSNTNPNPDPSRKLTFQPFKLSFGPWLQAKPKL